MILIKASITNDGVDLGIPNDIFNDYLLRDSIYLFTNSLIISILFPFDNLKLSQ